MWFAKSGVRKYLYFEEGVDEKVTKTRALLMRGELDASDEEVKAAMAMAHAEGLEANVPEMGSFPLTSGEEKAIEEERIGEQKAIANGEITEAREAASESQTVLSTQADEPSVLAALTQAMGSAGGSSDEQVLLKTILDLQQQKQKREKDKQQFEAEKAAAEKAALEEEARKKAEQDEENKKNRARSEHV